MNEPKSGSDKARYFRGRLRQAFAELNPGAWLAAPGAIFRDLVQPRKAGDRQVALPEIMGWLARAQDAAENGGVSIYYSLYGGYGAPYPEATGYIIPTMLRYADRFGVPEFQTRAVRAGDWLLSLQAEDGAMPGGLGGLEDPPLVFNTGQILFGLNALAESTQAPRFVEAAAKTAAWLRQQQDDDGAWRRHTYQDKPHVYAAMVAHALAEHHCQTGDKRARQAAEAHLRWAASQFHDNGFPGALNLIYWPNYLHFIAYTLQGLVEGAALLDLPQLWQKAEPAAQVLRDRFLQNDKLPGAFKEDWRPDGSYACLTGNAQISLVWSRLFSLTGEPAFREAAQKMTEQLAGTVRLSASGGVRGGVKGSHPIWGRYLALRYPCWAAKFTADALMICG
ncbi:MAG: terpene cyclase/mutase family protein [Acidobacteriota bacterium]|nr:terpene cyclase/mutase family protein [Acidobacteriota bacterium]